jgi:hypothetical protein
VKITITATIIHSVDEWNDAVTAQLKEIYDKPELSNEFSRLKKLFEKPNDAVRIREIIISHRELIPLLSDVETLKKQVWLNYFNKLDKPFSDYSEKITGFTTKIRLLYEKAAEQSERWQEVVSEFNRRFRVPFEVVMNNKANFLLKDEAPSLSFIYSRGEGDAYESSSLGKEDLMNSLSMGEKRALYLLYILFDLERIRIQASTGASKFLIIADDIADSFDYKNKYAIIEYLNDLSKNNGIDLLILTHNFDFYRTIKLRLGVIRPNCLIAQKSPNGKISMTTFRYQRDFFKNVIIAKIKNGQIDTDEKKKLLIASIPFYRNLSEYSGKKSDYLKLTCYMHLKTTPIDTSTAMLSDIWSMISPYLDNNMMSGPDEGYYSALHRIATTIVGELLDEVSLENKLIIAIAIRLTAETFLKRKLNENGYDCPDSGSNQTREWFNLAEHYLASEEKILIEDVNLITPESIHLNSFMYEPLIDISDWTLKELYNKVTAL